MFECGGRAARENCARTLSRDRTAEDRTAEEIAAIFRRLKLLEEQIIFASEQPELQTRLTALETAWDKVDFANRETRLSAVETAWCKLDFEAIDQRILQLESKAAPKSEAIERRVALLEESAELIESRVGLLEEADGSRDRRVMALEEAVAEPKTERFQQIREDFHSHCHTLEARIAAAESLMASEQKHVAENKIANGLCDASEDESYQVAENKIASRFHDVSEDESYQGSKFETKPYLETSGTDVTVQDSELAGSEPSQEKITRQVTDVLVFQALKEDLIHTFEETVWEAAILIGLQPIRLHGSVLLLFALTLNIAIQVTFSLVIRTTFPGEPENLDAMVEWRHVVGHHVSQVDGYGRSLTGRLCGSRDTLTVATSQDTILRDATVYTESDFYGPALCASCILIWYMIWVKDFERTALLLHKLLNYQSSSETCIIVAPCRDKMWLISGLHRSRKIFMSGVCMARMLVDTILLWEGSMWLIYTYCITELVNNALALSFIYEIDELLYEIFASEGAKAMLSRTFAKDQTAPQYKTARGTCKSFRCIFRSSCKLSVLVFTFILARLLVWPNNQNLKDIIDTLCNGEKDFAMAHHADLNMIFFSPTSHVSADASSEDSLSWKAIDEIINRQPVLSATELVDIVELNRIVAMSPSEVGDDLLGSCEDTVRQDLPRFWKAMQEDLGIPGDAVVTCQNVSGACGSPTVHLVRMLCPETCRCFYTRPSTAISNGCPYWLCQDNALSAGYYDTTVSCTDDSVSFLRGNTYWRDFWSSWNASQSTESRKSAHVEVVDYALNHGCDVVAKYGLSDELCADATDRHALGTFCPEACDCRNHDYWGCPRKCRLLRS